MVTPEKLAPTTKALETTNTADTGTKILEQGMDKDEAAFLKVANDPNRRDAARMFMKERRYPEEESPTHYIINV